MALTNRRADPFLWIAAPLAALAAVATTNLLGPAALLFPALAVLAAHQLTTGVGAGHNERVARAAVTAVATLLWMPVMLVLLLVLAYATV